MNENTEHRITCNGSKVADSVISFITVDGSNMAFYVYEGRFEKYSLFLDIKIVLPITFEVWGSAIFPLLGSLFQKMASHERNFFVDLPYSSNQQWHRRSNLALDVGLI